MSPLLVRTAGCILLLSAIRCGVRLKPLDVDFSRLTVEEMERATVELKIANPNPFALNIENLRYCVLLGDDTVAAGQRRTPVHLPASDTTLAEFPFTVQSSIGDLVSRLPEVAADTARFRLVGQYVLPAFLGRKSLGFEYTKQIPLAQELGKLLGPVKDLIDIHNWLPRKGSK